MSAAIGDSVTLLGLPPWREAKRMFERAYCRKVLQEERGNVSRAVRRTGQDRKSFYLMMHRCGVDPAEFRP